MTMLTTCGTWVTWDSRGMTEKIGLAVSYQNQIYDYEQDSGPNNRSAMLDRMEHLGGWKSVQVVAGNPGGGGYKYGIVEHTHEKAIFVPNHYCRSATTSATSTAITFSPGGAQF